MILDPDEQVQSVLRLIFAKFEERATGRQVFSYMQKHGIRIPVRPAYGPSQGQLEWREPTPSTLHRILRHPQYAGAYVYGRSPTDPRRKIPGRRGTGKTRVPMEQWQVLLRGALPAYITWEQYLANQERLKRNASQFETRGAPREGPSLLGGLVRCGRCGWRMYVAYRGSPANPIYCCRRDDPVAGNCRGQNLAANVVDDLVARQVLQILEPASVELTIGGQPFDHLVYHWVLTYSNGESITSCFSESFESLSEGLQNAVWELGGVPQRHRTDRMSLAVNNASSEKEFTRRYTGLLDYFGLEMEKIQPEEPNENGDVEPSHRRFKEAVEQALLLRGQRDFETGRSNDCTCTSRQSGVAGSGGDWFLTLASSFKLHRACCSCDCTISAA